MEREVNPVSPALQVFQVRKVQGTNLGKIYAMKVLRKVSHLFSQQILTPVAASPHALFQALGRH